VSAFLKLLARNRLALGGLIVMGIVVLLALITPLLPLADPMSPTRPTGSCRPFPKARCWAPTTSAATC
jgi:peptide/nickel transport system permease protein